MSTIPMVQSHPTCSGCVVLRDPALPNTLCRTLPKSLISRLCKRNEKFRSCSYVDFKGIRGPAAESLYDPLWVSSQRKMSSSSCPKAVPCEVTLWQEEGQPVQEPLLADDRSAFQTPQVV